jgi:hypothetical protein
MTPDAETVRRRLLSIVRLANRLRDNTADLHSLAYDPHTTGGEPDRGSFESRPPRAGNLKAQALLGRIAAEADAIEAVLIGLDRAMTGLFFAGSSNAEPSRGSLISRTEHDRLVANQHRRRRAGDYTPAALIDQPTHPGRKR